MRRLAVRPAFAVLVLTCSAALIQADSGAAHRVRTLSFGSSGGNVNDRTSRFCCSGTLGALVTDGVTQYILSNNHVLARTEQGVSGEDISQPGAIDVGCNISSADIVGDLTAAPPLTSNVDAAVAELRPGSMDPTGQILDLGIISNIVQAPAIGLDVAKSGRTTGLTTGSISSINTTVRVQYQARCGSGRKFTVTYNNQIVISSTTFSAGGDSGSLIVDNDVCPQPVGLLYAGSSSATIANPIGEVLTRIGDALGGAVSFVGGACATGGIAEPMASAAEAQFAVSDAEVDRATTAKEQHVRGLLDNPAVMAVGVGADQDNPGEAAIVVYVQTGRATLPIAARLGGVNTRIVLSDEIRAYGWNMPEGQSCQPN